MPERAKVQAEAGERHLDDERARNINGLGKVLAGWTAEEVADFAVYLRRFNTDVERLAGHP